jgi:hypothetical protein
MALTRFQRRIRGVSLGKAERAWFPKWVDGYRRHCHAEPDQDLPANESLVIGFLRSLRDNRIPAWRRLQAARAIEMYQEIVPETERFEFTPIKRKLHELARAENEDAAAPSNPRDRQLVDGEWHCGKLDSTEPKTIQRMRGRMRVLGYRRSTETAYVGWLRRSIRHVDDERLERYGEPEIADFLTELALTGHVVAGTQNQAISSLTHGTPANR